MKARRPDEAAKPGAGAAAQFCIRQASDRSFVIGRAKTFGPGGSRVINARTVGTDREEMIEMAALGLLLMIVVIGTIVYIAGVAWLARLDVRQDESPPRETISPNLPNLGS
jgi:hypothetical protein